MILKLRNKQIIIEEGGIPAFTAGVSIRYDYELGTNHYKTLLYINDQLYKGMYPLVPLDLDTDTVKIKVELLDTHDSVIRVYEGTFKYLKLCLIGEQSIVDIYEELQRLYRENKELKEKGDVI